MAENVYQRYIYIDTPQQDLIDISPKINDAPAVWSDLHTANNQITNIYFDLIDPKINDANINITLNIIAGASLH